ncbi:hypothetical protein NUU61_009212 [Penicillium alfredii]|uniref:Uncharacterized protein n=1 Tax=Penicillium alfredii TaxID=1506179 RepID=A0A9W9EMN1_9EURO|nr:uncharacterized protein NUU61_009212 [Penicillium alfredii]KAJ5084633.1 hypothetical protein NUU61_009212 [Penicillium alfredii]
MVDVYEYEVVLANGTIATTSQSCNPNLYFALRGGGNSFGIVIAFTFCTFAQGPVFTGMTSYAANQTEQVLDKVYDLYTDKHLTSDPEMGYDLFYIYYTYDSGNDEFGLRGTQRYGTPVQNPPFFHSIDQIPPLRRTTTISTMSRVVNGSLPLGTMRVFGIFKQEVEAIQTVPGLVPNFICYPLQRNAIAAMKQRRGNALGIERDEPLLSNVPSS